MTTEWSEDQKSDEARSGQLFRVITVLEFFLFIGGGGGGGGKSFLSIPRENGQRLILKNYF